MKSELDWLAPAYPEAKTPLTYAANWAQRTACWLGAYVLVVLYPAYVGLRMMWGNYQWSWTSLVVAVLAAVLFGLFAYTTIRRYVTVRPRSR